MGNEKIVKTKKVNGNLDLDVSTANTDRLIVSLPEAKKNLRANKVTSRSENKRKSRGCYQLVNLTFVVKILFSLLMIFKEGKI